MLEGSGDCVDAAELEGGYSGCYRGLYCLIRGVDTLSWSAASFWI